MVWNKITTILLLVATFAFANWTGSTSEPSNMRKIDGKSFYVITSTDELAWFAAQVNRGNTDINAVLNNDIIFGKDKNTTGTVDWIPIGNSRDRQFAGILDGAGYTIYGLYMSGSSSYAGLVGVLAETGTVENITMAVGNITGSSDAGAIVALSHGTIQNAKNQNSIRASANGYVYAGGIAGVNDGIILNSNNSGEVSARDRGDKYSYSGGIAGSNLGEIHNCYNQGRVTSGDTLTKSNTASDSAFAYSGGIAGQNSGTISNSRNNSKGVKSAVYTNIENKSGGIVYSRAKAYSGGIVGFNTGKVFKCHNESGSISSATESRALSGRSEGLSNGNPVSGVNGSASTTAISYSYAGGISGYNKGKIYDCYSGYAGLTSTKASSKYYKYETSDGVYSSGYHTFDAVTDVKSYYGGIVGQNSGTTKTSYYKTEYWLNNATVTGSIENMQTDQFAWMLNTCNGTVANSGSWTHGSSGYPTFANEDSLAIYKIVFNDDGVRSIRYTNYLGLVSFPDDPEPAEGFIFTGWFNSEDVRVKTSTIFSADETINAVYVDASELYWTIRFFNSDAEQTLLESKQYQHGSIVTYGGETPTREATAQYTYTFKGWNVEPTNAVENFDYHAVYDSTIRSYTITFNNHDGTKIESSTFEYGKMPSCNQTPTRAATAEWVYTHRGWKPALDYVTEATSYTATYDSTKVKYKVTFMNGTTAIDEQMIPYGEGATAPTNVTREGYRFIGWNTSFSNITENLTVKALFEEIIYYTITIKTEEGTITNSLEENSEFKLPIATTKEGHTFNGWYDNEGTFIGNSGDKITITDNLTLEAKYTVISYTITFADEDGSVISSTKVAYGTIPIAPDDPTKASTAQYTYTFAGWDKEITKVTGTATYTATYNTNLRNYTITFADEDGSEISSTKVAYGTIPIAPDDPTKASTAQYIYTFAGWDKEITKVSGTATYTATYNKSIRKYLVTFLDYDGSVLDEQSVAYGNSAEKPLDPSRNGYKFVGWNEDYSTIVKKTDVTALYEKLSSSSSAYSSSSIYVKPSSSSENSSSESSVKSSGSFANSSSGSSIKSSNSSAKSSNSGNKNTEAFVASNIPTFYVSVVEYSIQIANAKVGSAYAIFDMQGRVLKKGRVESANFNIPMNMAGNYLVRVDNRTLRISIK